MSSSSINKEMSSTSINKEMSSNSQISIGQWHESNCYCGIRARIRRASTKLNNGRRFVGCAKYLDRSACRYFEWIDPDDLEVYRARVDELEMELRMTSEGKQKLEMELLQEKEVNGRLRIELLQEKEDNRRWKSENGCLRKKLIVIVIVVIMWLIVVMISSIDNDSRKDGRFRLP